jgi:hypothetical protein
MIERTFTHIQNIELSIGYPLWDKTSPLMRGMKDDFLHSKSAKNLVENLQTKSGRRGTQASPNKEIQCALQAVGIRFQVACLPTATFSLLLRSTSASRKLLPKDAPEITTAKCSSFAL